MLLIEQDSWISDLNFSLVIMIPGFASLRISLIRFLGAEISSGK